MSATYAKTEAIRELNHQGAAARRLAEQLDRYAEQLRSDTDVPMEERFRWAINEIENYLRNINFSVLAARCVELATRQ